MFIVFDTETTGLPEDYNAPITDFENWPRIVQLAWKVYDLNGKEISSHNRIIKPDNFIIPEESVAIHRITNEKANKYGIPLIDALNEFSNSIKSSKFLVAHNISFDNKVTACEFLRYDMHNYMRDITHICTMNSTVDFCRIQGKMGLKFPTLTELHEKLFDRKFQDAHDALIDVEALAKCFFKLREINALGFKKDSLMFLDSKESEKNILEKWKQKNGKIPIPTPMVNLGIHTYHSVLEGAGSVSDYINVAKENNHESLVLTDKTNMSGSFAFYQKCKSENIKPIIGCDFYLNDSIGEKYEPKLQDRNVSQKIIITNEKGYVNINKINYLSFTEGYYRVPRIKTEWITNNKEGLLITTSSKDGTISKYLQMGKYSLAEKYIVKMLSIFGAKNFIAEISLQDNEIQRQYNNFIINMVNKYNMAIVISNEIYYTKKEDNVIQDVLISVNQKKSIKNSRTKENREMYYINENDIIELNKDYAFNYEEEFLRVCMITSHRVSKICNYDFEINIEKYPQYKPTEDVISYFKESETEGIMKKLAHSKLNQKLKLYEQKGPIKIDEQIVQEYRERLDYEIDVIKEKKMLDYFLVVWELIRYCADNDISVGPGRGCFLPGSRVKMADNMYVPIDTIEIGDMVIDAFGDEREVIDTLEYDIEEDIIELEFDDGRVIECTLDHEILTENRGWVQAKDLTEKDEIVDINKN